LYVETSKESILVCLASDLLITGYYEQSLALALLVKTKFIVLPKI